MRHGIENNKVLILHKNLIHEKKIIRHIDMIIPLMILLIISDKSILKLTLQG
jgi:hypothetical protein